jgi:hypothetical protein
MVPVQPQARAVLTAWAARLSAPRAEGVPAAQPGGDCHRGRQRVLTAAMSAFSPRTSTDLPWIFVRPNLAPSFLWP